MSRALLLGCLGCVALALSACGRTVKSGGEPTAAADGGGASSGGNATSGGAPAQDCSQPQPGPSPLTRLGNFELNRSVRDLMPSAVAPDAASLLHESEQENDPASLVSETSVQLFHRLAHNVALQLSENDAAIQAVAGCDPVALGNEKCQSQFLEQFLKRAYRRAVTDEDREEMNAVFATGTQLGGNFASGVRAVVEVALQNPDFMYLVEQGNGSTTADSVALTGYESAARLAYFLTGTTPDDQLLAAADAGPLTADALEKQARRLLGTAPSRELVRHFYSMLLRLDDLPANFEQGYTADIAALTREETGRFVEDVTFDGAGTLRALLTEPSTWVNGALAGFYDYPPVTGDAFQKIAVDPLQRGGILTQSAFLRATSHVDSTSPVHRSVAVLRDFLCVQLPAPPASIPAPAPSDGSGMTTRQRLEAQTANPVCQSCHHIINPVGFAFEHYDLVGRWRATENGLPIDASGELSESDAQGKFGDAIELISRIAESADAKNCFVGHWLTDAYRRPEDPSDGCARANAEQIFSQSDGNLIELAVALAKTDSFRYRLKSELGP